MDINHISGYRYAVTIIWAMVICVIVVGSISLLAHGSLNLKGALTEKPDLALYLLLPEEEISESELLRETETVRDYLAETKDGPKYIKLKKGEEKWYVAEIENLHK